MTDLVVGRSEGIAYPNNNLTYERFKPTLIETNTNFIESMVKEINEAESDEEIKLILYKVYITTQFDSYVRAEFDNYYNKK